MEGFEETPALSPASQQGSCLWIGDLSVWMDENWLKHTFLPTSALVSCKVIRHKTTQMSRGYGFLLFNSNEAANFVLTQLNGKLIPGTDQVFRLNWAANGRQGATGPSDYSLFVGDLTEEVTDYMLQEAFRRYYPSVRSAKVMRAPLSGRSRNFGFCRFANQQERDRALVEMNGHEICDRPVRVSLATAKKIQPGGAGLDAPPAAAENTFNATLFVGGLTDAASEEDLRGMFSLFGDLVSVKCLAAKGCAFVQYQTAAAAKAAMTMLQDQAIGGAPMRISWGRQNSVPRPPAPNFANSTSSYSYPGAVIPGSTFNPEYGGPRLAGVGGHPVSLSPHSYPAPQDSYGAHDPAALLAHPRLPNLGGHSSGMSMAPGVPPLQQGMPDAQQVEQLFGNLALHAGGSRNIQRPFM